MSPLWSNQTWPSGATQLVLDGGPAHIVNLTTNTTEMVSSVLWDSGQLEDMQHMMEVSLPPDSKYMVFDAFMYVPPFCLSLITNDRITMSILPHKNHHFKRL